MRQAIDAALHARFWAKVCRTEGGCWLWTGGCNHPGGYGRINIGGKMWLAHRLSWVIARGPIPPGLDVLHRCDNPPCVRFDHLFVGTDRDNALDRERKGRGVRRSGNRHWARATPELVRRGDRHWSRLYPPEYRARGERQGSSKLTEAQVAEIRSRYAAGERNKTALGRDFGITRQAVHYITTRRGWSHVP